MTTFRLYLYPTGKPKPANALFALLLSIFGIMVFSLEFSPSLLLTAQAAKDAGILMLGFFACVAIAVAVVVAYSCAWWSELARRDMALENQHMYRVMAAGLSMMFALFIFCQLSKRTFLLYGHSDTFVLVILHAMIGYLMGVCVAAVHIVGVAMESVYAMARRTARIQRVGFCQSLSNEIIDIVDSLPAHLAFNGGQSGRLGAADRIRCVANKLESCWVSDREQCLAVSGTPYRQDAIDARIVLEAVADMVLRPTAKSLREVRFVLDMVRRGVERGDLHVALGRIKAVRAGLFDYQVRRFSPVKYLVVISGILLSMAAVSQSVWSIIENWMNIIGAFVSISSMSGR